jgi:hypothetical protein
MSFDPSKRLRFGVSKVRSGCLTCKSRHLKCDEAQPSCLRCIRSQRECRRRKSELRELSIVHYISPAPSHPISEWPSLTPSEQRWFYIFRTWTGPELAGAYNSELWLRYITHIALSEPAIKHAILGVTALHKQFRNGKDNTAVDDDMAYALNHYTSALGLLVQSMKSSSVAISDTPLVACILFCAFESMSFHLDSAISHAGSGVKMLKERHGCTNTESPCAIPDTLINALYCRLDTQRLELGETSVIRQARFGGYGARNVSKFRSIEDLQISFDELANSILHTIYDVDRASTLYASACTSEKAWADNNLQSLVFGFSQWCCAYDKFVLEKAEKIHLAPLVLLQLWRILITINLQVDLGSGEMDFDRFESEFDQITDLSYAFVLAEQGLPTEAALQPNALDNVPSNPTYTVHRLATSMNNMRGGYLGIHPRCTPLVRRDESKSHSILATTQHLQRKVRSSHRSMAISTKPRDAKTNQYIPKPIYCFSPGIVSPLYVAISRCRDPQIRRRALVLMLNCKRREGLWDSELAARLGARVIEIEEHRAKALNCLTFETSAAFRDWNQITSSNQIPNDARVRMIKPTFLPDRKSIERYYFGWSSYHEASDEMEEVWIEEMMEW